jgi:SAM-dependent methyltransferase
MICGLHPAAAGGFAAGASAYEAGRPGYPPEAVRWLTRELRIGPGRRALDLAAGTGKLTSALVATGADVVAVEPVAEMRAILEKHVPAALVLAGRAEAIPLAAGSVHAATVAQAFHWFDAVHAIEELHRVLGPDGRLGVIFNVRDETVRWQARLSELFRPLEGDTPRHRHGAWRAALDASARFERPREARFPFGPATTIDGVLDRVRSMSFVAAAEPRSREQLLRAVRALLAEDPETAGRETFPFPYRTECLALDRGSPGVP